MSLPPDLPVPSTSRVLRPRSRGSRPTSSNSHGSSISGNGGQMANNMSANPNNPSTNPTFPGHNGLIGPGRSGENPAGLSSSRAMEGQDVNQWWDPTRIQVLTGVQAMALVIRTTSCLGILSIIHPISALALRILTTTLTSRIPMNDGKSRSEDFQDLRWDRESRHWREPWEKERNGNERILLRIPISIHFLGHPILATLWTTIGRRLMLDRRIWGHILIIGSPLVRSRASGSMDTRYFDEGRFLIDFQSMMRTVKLQWAE
jgi:hypothetical protein